MISFLSGTNLWLFKRIQIFTAILLFFSVFVQGQVIFEIDNFKAKKEDLSLVGSAKYHENVLRICPAMKNQVGAVWYKEQQIDLDKGFFTEFEFRISNKDAQLNGGDGFAFVIQNQSPDIASGVGDDIGYKGLKDVLAIEFDIFNNKEESKNHVCLSFYDENENYYRRYATVHEIPELSDGNAHFARVEYKEGQIQFYLDGYLFPILTVNIDIAAKIGAEDNKAWIGFTSATSEAYADHDLLSWSVGEYNPAPEEISEETVEVKTEKELGMKNRKLKITIWDDNLYDQDTISIKIGNEWVLTNYEVTAKKKVIYYTLRGFSSEMILYAHNTGLIPPNTAAVEVDDGKDKYQFLLKSDLKTAEAVRFKYSPTP